MGFHRVRYHGRGTACIHRDGSSTCQDLVLEICQIKHSQFERIGNDLVTFVQLDPQIALCGGNMTISTLDHREIRVSPPPAKASTFRGKPAVFMHAS